MSGKTNSINGTFAGLGHYIPSSFVLSGNPNTNTGGNSQAGQLGDFYFDTAAGIEYTCTVGGASGVAVWTPSSASGSAFVWNNTTTNAVTMAANNGYVNNSTALGVYTLPATATVGQRVAVSGASTFGFQISQNAGQTIFFNAGTTTAGTAGNLTSSGQYDAVTLQCITANTGWKILEVVGNLNYV